MSGYIPGHIIDECRDLRRQGHSLATLARRAGVDADHLANLLGEPTLRPVPTTDEPDLWRTHEIDDVI